MKILITGISGRIGKSLLSFFEGIENTQLYFIVKKHREELANHEQILWDLNEASNFDFSELYFDRVIHMAAIAHDLGARSVLEINQLTTKNLFEAIDGCFEQFIFFSSISVYGESNRSYPIRVEDKCEPTSFYGISKLRSEKFLEERVENLLIFRLCPMIDGDGIIDLEKRIFLPKTKIKYKSPYKREYSFSTIDSIENYLRANSLESTVKGILNVSDDKKYSELELLEMSPGEQIVKIPKFFLAPLFGFCSMFSGRGKIRNIQNILWKLFKENTFS